MAVVANDCSVSNELKFGICDLQRSTLEEVTLQSAKNGDWAAAGFKDTLRMVFKTLPLALSEVRRRA